jgi:GNAT superfamily N-acetyltransferase
MPRVTVTRTYLRLKKHLALQRAPLPPGVVVRTVMPCPVALSRAMYREVGGPWHWVDRLAWSDEQLAAHLDRPTVRVLRLEQGEAFLGFAELERHADGAVEIVYFGLVPDAIGVGLGKGFLTAVVDEAFAMFATHVWLHTCTLDHPHALRSYEMRGFERYQQEQYETDVPEEIP